jgi:hypothetical protein
MFYFSSTYPTRISQNGLSCVQCQTKQKDLNFLEKERWLETSFLGSNIIYFETNTEDILDVPHTEGDDSWHVRNKGRKTMTLFT